MHLTVRITLLMLIITAAAHAQEAGRYEHYDVYDRDLLPLQEYAGRRARVLARLGDSSAMLVRAADQLMRSNDVEYEFRQRNSLLYLTGVEEPASA
ncbi:MAG: aminopeptidase P N-terminal domain-containing protein, partial [bacterium]|nr:aminopeptidase P N-terminal domain-containing protein [Candidatus Kapabacteria bacterium]